MKQCTLSIVVDLGNGDIAYLPLATVSEKKDLAAGDALWSLAENWVVLTEEFSQQIIAIYKDLPNEVAHTPTSALANFLRTCSVITFGLTGLNKSIRFEIIENEI